MASDLEIYAALLNISNLTVEKTVLTDRELNIYCKIEKNTPEPCPLCQQEVGSKPLVSGTIFVNGFELEFQQFPD